MTVLTEDRLLRGLRDDGNPMSLAEHTATHGPLTLPPAGRGPSGALLEMIGRSGLRGRGGAGFPIARKLDQVVRGGGRPVVVANGSEGEPASEKDRVLLHGNPHLVLEGAAVAAATVGADQVVVAVHTSTLRAVGAAIRQRETAGRDAVSFRTVTVPDRFIAGQETALVDFLNDGPGLPTHTRLRPAQRGVGGQPTLVSNAETLAHLALLARHGPAWFRAVGTEDEPGTTLITLQGAVAAPGVYEIERGSTLDQLLAQAGGVTAPVQAYLIGGYAGAWIAGGDTTTVQLSESGLAGVGGTLGAGVVLALPADLCGLALTAEILAYLAAEGAGQCGPCVHGLPAIAGGMRSLARGQAPRDTVQLLESWSWQVRGRGACAHPDGAARLAVSALRVFRHDVAAHGARRCAGAEGSERALRALAGIPGPAPVPVRAPARSRR